MSVTAMNFKGKRGAQYVYLHLYWRLWLGLEILSSSRN